MNTVKHIAGMQRALDLKMIRDLEKMSDSEMQALGILDPISALEYAGDMLSKNDLVDKVPSEA